MGKPKQSVAPASNHFVRKKPDPYLESLLDTATAHAEDTFEPDHEVGDLQDLARDVWALLTEAQRDVIKTDPHWQDFLERWGA